MKGTVYVNNGYWWYAVRLPGEKKRKARKLCAPGSEIALHADRSRDVAIAAAQKVWEAATRHVPTIHIEGKTVDEKSITEGYDHFQIEGSDVVLFNDKEVYIYRIGGRDKIRVEMRKNLSYVAAVDGVNEFLFVGETYLERVRLVGEKR